MNTFADIVRNFSSGKFKYFEMNIKEISKNERKFNYKTKYQSAIGDDETIFFRCSCISEGESSTQDPDYEEDNHFVEMMKETLKIRKNYKSKQWKYFTRILNGCSVVDIPANANIIGIRWVFIDKFVASGIFVKAKARLAPLGYQQKKGIDYVNTFVPVVMMPSSRFLHVLRLLWGKCKVI